MEPLLPPKDIPKTMCQPKVQQDLSRFIIEQPTEWQSSKPWSCLDEYMHDEAKPGWDATKEQIDKLAWWDEVNTQAKLNLGSTVMNIHPVALVNNMLKLNKCFCDRDFATEEINKIVKALRDYDGIKNYNLFTSKNCNIPQKDKTYERFAEEINLMMNKYNIDSCLRKAHFLAQAYPESDAFRTTEEYGNDIRYDPYRGRGLMQLTHSGELSGQSGYKQYFEHLKRTDYKESYNKVSDDLSLAIDSSGWYWVYGSAWGNLNNDADNDDLYVINIGVNGGFNGFQKRKAYIQQLIKIMNISSCRNSKNHDVGIYSYKTSRIKDTRYGKNRKKE